MVVSRSSALKKMLNKKIRLIKPAWYETLEFLVEMLDEEKEVELIEELSQGYFEYKKQHNLKDYNPYIDDLSFVEGYLIKKEYNQNDIEISASHKKEIMGKVSEEWLRFGTMDMRYGGKKKILFLLPPTIKSKKEEIFCLREELLTARSNSSRYYFVYVNILETHRGTKPTTY